MVVPSEHASAELLHALSRLLGAVKATALPFETDDSSQTSELRDSISDQVSNYILPRLVQLEAPLLVVVGGSTGAGKSTLVNSLIGERVTAAGVLRPTTRSPVLIHHPDDQQWFEGGRVLPELTRSAHSTPSTHAVKVTSSENIPQGLALLDAPDFDSIDTTNRELASQLLAAADLWLFVTSAARYADQVPWDYLRSASERSTAVAVVLDRVHEDGLAEVRGHLARMMTSRGLSDSPLFSVFESPVDTDGLVPATAVQHIWDWLKELADDSEARVSVVSKTLDGAVRQIVFHTHDVADAMDAQIQAAEYLHAALDSSFSLVHDAINMSLADGSLISGSLAARWQEFLGGGELFRSMEDKVGRIRDRLIDGVRGKRTRSAQVIEAIDSSVTYAVLEAIESAAETTVNGWTQEPYGRTIVQQNPGIDRAAASTRARAQRIAHDWQLNVTELARTATADKRMSSDFLAFGVNGVAVAAMIGAMSAQEGQSSRVPRQLLNSVLGPLAAESLIDAAAHDLHERVGDVIRMERGRFEALFSQPDAVRDGQAELREAAKRTEFARHTDFLEAEW